jgi:lipopolysaccharide export system protein LptA
MHVLAERADLDHATGTATFHGTPVRMWQSGSRIEAPVIEVGQTPKRLFAHAENAGGRDAQVHAVLMNAGSDADASRGASGPKPCPVNAGAGGARAAVQGAAEPQMTRITSGALIYSDASGEADFTGGLRAEMGEVTVRADTGTVYLKKDNPKSASTGSKMPSLNGRIDHVLAKGQITIAQPGLHATGEQLLYTGAEQSFLLTGNAKNLPRAMDARGNVTTGAALKFRRACSGGGGDTTVEVLNKAPSGLDIPGGVHTEVLAEEKKGRSSR